MLRALRERWHGERLATLEHHHAELLDMLGTAARDIARLELELRSARDAITSLESALAEARGDCDRRAQRGEQDQQVHRNLGERIVGIEQVLGLGMGDADARRIVALESRATALARAVKRRGKRPRKRGA